MLNKIQAQKISDRAIILETKKNIRKLITLYDGIYNRLEIDLNECLKTYGDLIDSLGLQLGVKKNEVLKTLTDFRVLSTQATKSLEQSCIFLNQISMVLNGKLALEEITVDYVNNIKTSYADIVHKKTNKDFNGQWTRFLFIRDSNDNYAFQTIINMLTTSTFLRGKQNPTQQLYQVFYGYLRSLFEILDYLESYLDNPKPKTLRADLHFNLDFILNRLKLAFRDTRYNSQSGGVLNSSLAKKLSPKLIIVDNKFLEIDHRDQDNLHLKEIFILIFLSIENKIKIGPKLNSVISNAFINPQKTDILKEIFISFFKYYIKTGDSYEFLTAMRNYGALKTIFPQDLLPWKQIEGRPSITGINLHSFTIDEHQLQATRAIQLFLIGCDLITSSPLKITGLIPQNTLKKMFFPQIDCQQDITKYKISKEYLILSKIPYLLEGQTRTNIEGYLKAIKKNDIGLVLAKYVRGEESFENTMHYACNVISTIINSAIHALMLRNSGMPIFEQASFYNQQMMYTRNGQMASIMAALLHDIGKGKLNDNHEIAGARVITKLLKPLKLPVQTIEFTEELVRLHNVLNYLKSLEEGSPITDWIARSIDRPGLLFLMTCGDRIGAQASAQATSAFQGFREATYNILTSKQKLGSEQNTAKQLQKVYATFNFLNVFKSLDQSRIQNFLDMMGALYSISQARNLRGILTAFSVYEKERKYLFTNPGSMIFQFEMDPKVDFLEFSECSLFKGILKQSLIDELIKKGSLIETKKRLQHALDFHIKTDLIQLSKIFINHYGIDNYNKYLQYFINPSYTVVQLLRHQGIINEQGAITAIPDNITDFEVPEFLSNLKDELVTILLKKKKNYKPKLIVYGLDRPGLARDLTSILKHLQVNYHSINCFTGKPNIRKHFSTPIPERFIIDQITLNTSTIHDLNAISNFKTKYFNTDNIARFSVEDVHDLTFPSTQHLIQSIKKTELKASYAIFEDNMILMVTYKKDENPDILEKTTTFISNNGFSIEALSYYHGEDNTTIQIYLKNISEGKINKTAMTAIINEIEGNK